MAISNKNERWTVSSTSTPPMKPERSSELMESCETSNCHSDLAPKCPKRTFIHNGESSITSVDDSFDSVLLRENTIDFMQSIRSVETKSTNVDSLIGMVILFSVSSQTTVRI